MTEPFPVSPPCKPVPEDDSVQDPHDKICMCVNPENRSNCSRVALFSVFFENTCRHVEPYLVCLPHRDMLEYGMTELHPMPDVQCRQCTPALSLGRLLDIKKVRDPE